jgi:hypothetical protein
VRETKGESEGRRHRHRHRRRHRRGTGEAVSRHKAPVDENLKHKEKEKKKGEAKVEDKVDGSRQLQGGCQQAMSARTERMHGTHEKSACKSSRISAHASDHSEEPKSPRGRAVKCKESKESRAVTCKEVGKGADNARSGHTQR